MNTTHLTNASLTLFAAAACALSGWLTVQLVTSVQNTTLAAGVGLTLHGMQYSLASAARSKHAHRIIKTATWAITATLFTLSVSASVAFLEHGYQQKASQNQSQQRQAQYLDLLESNLENRQAVAQRLHQVDKVTASGQHLNQLSTELQTAIKLNKELTNGSASQLPALIELAATATGATTTAVRLTLFTTVGALLDTTALLALFYLLSPPSRNTSVSEGETQKHPVSEREKLMQRITSGEFGSNPQQAQVAKETGVSKATVHRAFKALKIQEPSA